MISLQTDSGISTTYEWHTTYLGWGENSIPYWNIPFSKLEEKEKKERKSFRFLYYVFTDNVFLAEMKTTVYLCVKEKTSLQPDLCLSRLFLSNVVEAYYQTYTEQLIEVDQPTWLALARPSLASPPCRAWLNFFNCEQLRCKRHLLVASIY